jgi:putative FmdB family regulatory protein
MPIYEYVCKDCKNHFEELLASASSATIVKCPQCEGLNVKKTISAGGFRIGGGSSPIPSGALSGCSAKRGFS